MSEAEHFQIIEKKKKNYWLFIDSPVDSHKIFIKFPWIAKFSAAIALFQHTNVCLFSSFYFNSHTITRDLVFSFLLNAIKIKINGNKL